MELYYQEIWPCQRKCVTVVVVVSFDVSYAQATPCKIVHFLFLADQDVEIQDSSPAPGLSA